MDSFTLTTTIPASPKEIFEAWLTSEGHSQMTGSKAEVQEGADGEFTAWDGYISGRTLKKEPHHRIVQAWRTSEFPDNNPDSRVEITLDEVHEGTKITLIHKQIPDGQGDNYKQGWEEFYFTPMRAYFGK